MTRTEQRRFVRKLASNVLKDILAQSARWPSHWDGHQLRALLADRFEDANYGRCSRRKPIGPGSQRAHRRDRKEYENDKIIANL